MGDNVVLAVTIVLLITIVVAGVCALVGLKLRRRMFAGPARNAWELTRADLSPADQWQVRRATSRRRPVNRGSLAPAQLVYTRYAQFAAERSPLRRPWVRVAFAVLYLALAAQQLVDGVTQHGAHWFEFGCGGIFLVLALLWGLLMEPMLARVPLKMKRLRREIRQRWPDDWA
jgi:hypothetical protein